ncbi:MAG: ABC transporter ATP-binding protein [Desulfuromonadaceae bacterium]|nr:ABC transporter ATP-binding protein [Desulfuromonadaceae bacterium]
MTPILSLQSYSYAWPGASSWTLREVNLEVKAGECHCLTGGTGSGKSTLALAVKGLLPSGRQAGGLILNAASDEDRVAVGLVMQNPETQLLTETVGAEVAFGLENLCRPPEEMPNRVVQALAAAGLDLPLDHPTSRLSMGQKYRLLIAAHLVLQPALLILDEPGGQLDSAGLHSLSAIIGDLKERGLSVLLCEHRPDRLLPVVDRFWRLSKDGRLHQGLPPSKPSPNRARQPSPDASREKPLVEVRNLEVEENDAAPVWSGISFTLREGERAVLQAANGTGKTTLLRCLAGFITPRQGTVKVFGESPKPEKLRGRVGFLFQNPLRQLFETTVFDEVAFVLRRTGKSPAEVSERIESILQLCGIDHLARSSPHQLSYGQKHLVALAAVIIAEPRLLLLDDPFAGLDTKYLARIIQLLIALNEEKGITLLWTTHNRDNNPPWAHRHLTIEGKRIVSNHC